MVRWSPLNFHLAVEKHGNDIPVLQENLYGGAKARDKVYILGLSDRYYWEWPFAVSRVQDKLTGSQCPLAITVSKNKGSITEVSTTASVWYCELYWMNGSWRVEIFRKEVSNLLRLLFCKFLWNLLISIVIFSFIICCRHSKWFIFHQNEINIITKVSITYFS